MKGLRSKFIFTLLVYFAGFATAVYTLAPAPKGEAGEHSFENVSQADFDSEQFIESFNSGMHKCLEFGKEAAVRTGKLLKDKAKELHDA